MKGFWFLWLTFNTSVALGMGVPTNSVTRSGIEYPNFQIFVNNQNNYRTEMRCDEKNGITIECSFKGVVIMPVNTKQDEAFVASLKAEGDEYIKEILGRIKEQTQRSGCGNLSSIKDASDEELNWDKTLCEALLKSNSRADLVENFERVLERKKQTCLVAPVEEPAEFKYDAATSRWESHAVASQTPEGRESCDPLKGYLEKDFRKEGRVFSWNFVSQPIDTKTSERVARQPCSPLFDTAASEEISYGLGSGQYGTSKLMNCKYIDFSELL